MPEELKNGDKQVVGLIEIVKVIGTKGDIDVKALFYTGATRSSVDISLAAKVGLGPVVGSVKVKKTEGSFKRAIVKGQIEIKGKKHNVKFALADRKGLNCPILIGRDLIHDYYVVDPSLTHDTHLLKDLKKELKEEFEVLEEYD